jgi:signal transduction histidine kinase
MYFISSYTVKERDEAQQLLFDEHKENLKKQIEYEKELVFTKRIYHAHHKAEKVMGFIKEDLRILSPRNISEIIYRVTKYSNFVSRVIYDMKWYDPPVQTIRNQIFHTDLNEVIGFISQNIFRRVYSKKGLFDIKFDLDPKIPKVSINEFVIWEIIEPLIQNSIDHNGEKDLIISVSTKYSFDEDVSYFIIADNGKGIPPEFLEIDDNGIKKLFNENISSKKSKLQNSGYGCYIAYTMCRRCGWDLDAVNNPEAGCSFIIKIK